MKKINKLQIEENNWQTNLEGICKESRLYGVLNLKENTEKLFFQEYKIGIF